MGAHSRNAAAGSEEKSFSGALVNGLMDVTATFDSGAVIAYRGTVTAAMEFYGTCTVMGVGSQPQSFKPAGTRGSMGGRIDIRRSRTLPVQTNAAAQFQEAYYQVPEWAAAMPAGMQQMVQEARVAERDLLRKVCARTHLSVPEPRCPTA